ncbi:putative trans-sialidase, partial [Trypanosoma cruzi]
LNISDGSMDISTSDLSLFRMQLVDTAASSFGTTEVLRPTTVVIGEIVYMLVGKYSPTKSQDAGTNERGLLLVKGTVTDEGGNNKKLVWNETHVVDPQRKGESVLLTEFLGGGGSGAVMGDGAIVFPMQAKNKDVKRVLLSMSFNPSDKKWELSSTATGKGCRDPTLVKWKEDDDERLFMMAHCAGGYYDVYSSISDGYGWNTLGEPLNRVWGNSHNRKGHGVQSGFTTATIEGKEVMLITAPVYAKDNEEGRLHLWVTDTTRVYDVGPVSRGGDDAAASSLLIKDNNKELISLYENKKDGAYNLVAVRLTEKLERIKEVVKTWKDLDGALQSCSSGSSVTVDFPKKGMCNGPVTTERLVGFLSGNSTVTEWRDEYLGVNAIVHGPAEKRIGVPNGWTFKGPGAWAEWPVGDMGQTVPYYFANNEFTLAATVSIHEVPEVGSVPLIGVRMNDTDSTVLFGLSYTHDKKWLAIPENSGDAEDFDDWEPNRTYQVGLRMDDDDEWTFFVDQREIDRNRYNTSLFDFHRISHFYIGGDSKDQSATGGHVTVTNVMLYNERLLGSDLRKLNAGKVTIPSLGVEKQPTGQAASTDISVASESKSEETTAASHELPGDDNDEQVEGIVNDPVPAAPSSTLFAGASISESAIAAEIAENSLPENNAQLSEGKTVQQAALNEAKESMQRDSDVQPQDLQSEKLTVFSDVEKSSESNDTEEPEEDGGTNDRSGGSTSSVAASLSMATAAASVNGEHQVQQSVEPSAENNDVRSTGTGTTGAEESLSLEARDGSSERTMNSGSSITPSKSDAEPTSAEDTDNISRTEGTEVSSEDGKEAPQTVDTAPGNTNTAPGEAAIPSESNATTPSDRDILLEKGHYSELAAMALIGDGTVHWCVSQVLLL